MNGGGKSCIDGFNVARKNISASSMKVGDDFMSAIRFRMTEKGNLTHFPYIFRKPDPLGTEFKTFACSITWDLIFVEVHRMKEEMNHRKYQKELGATAACTRIIMEATKGIGQNYIKGVMKDCFLFDDWFSSNKAEEAVMGVGAELIDMVKKNNKGL